MSRVCLLALAAALLACARAHDGDHVPRDSKTTFETNLEGSDCEPLEKECQQLQHCDLGIEKITGADGCERCKCKEKPCNSTSCAADERCVLQKSLPLDESMEEPLFSSECMNMSKPGACPREQTSPLNDTCPRECVDDADCRGVGKCCRRGCSHLCLEPVQQSSFQYFLLALAIEADPIRPYDGIARDKNATVTGELDKPLQVRCLASGFPPPSVRWYRGREGAKELNNNTEYEVRDSVLAIRSLSTDTLGPYTCHAYNAAGASASWVVTVQAYAPPGLLSDHEFVIRRDSEPPSTTTIAAATETSRTPFIDCTPYEQECEALDCQYGVERFMQIGCQRCKCKENPCERKACAVGERCVVQLFVNALKPEPQYSGKCRAMTKTGACPIDVTTSNEVSCRRECVDDADCRGVGKCCRRGCSDLCLVPVEQTSPNPLLTTTIAASKDVPAPPQAVLQQEPQVEASEGGAATLRCLLHGNPPPKITWRFGELTIDGNAGRYRLMSDGALEIVSLYRNDTGVYICEADNGLGQARQEIHLIVNVPVSTHVSSPLSTLNIGADLRLTCEVDGFPEPDVHWTKDGATLQTDGRITITGSTIVSRLTVSRVTVADSGLYACHASNAYSSQSDSAQINVQQFTVPAKCTDNNFLVNCDMIVRSKFCRHKYYSKFCCKSCVEAGQLNPQEAELQTYRS